MKLTEKEKQIIRDLALHPYTVEYCEEWMNRKPENVVTNAPAALVQLGVEEFVKTIRHIAKVGLTRRNEDYILLDSITVGKTEYVLGKLDSDKTDMWVTWAKDIETDHFYWGHYFSEEAKAKFDLVNRAMEVLVPQVYNGAEKTPSASDDSAHKEGICPVCGGSITYGEFDLIDEGGTYDWECNICGATGREGYDLVWDGSHYDVELADGTDFEDIPAGHIAVMTVDPKTIRTLTPMLQCQSLDYGANRICKNELLFTKTVEIGYGYSAELRVTASDDGDPLNVNVWLLCDDELVYDYDGEDTILGTWVLENEDGEKFLLVIKEDKSDTFNGGNNQYKSVTELSRDQLNALKDSLFWQIYHDDSETPPFCVVENAKPYTRDTLPDFPTEIPDEVVFKVFAGVAFVDDDFICPGETNHEIKQTTKTAIVAKEAKQA